MRINRYSFAETSLFSDYFLDYIDNQFDVKDFFERFPSPENFKEQIAEKKQKFTAEKRQLLVRSLRKQYQNLETEFDFDILLSENTFTVTTGHQLVLLTGPLYFHYKIMTVIALAEELKRLYPEYNFIPVFWQASEDHDFEEIASVKIFGKKYTWQTEQKGAVGRFHTADLREVFEQIPDLPRGIADFYLQSETLAEATRKMVHHFYGKKNLIIIDGDDPALKKSFAEIMRKDLFENVFYQEVEQTNKKIAERNYPAQIHPRKINLFYLDENLRARIERAEDGFFSLVNTDIKFSEKEIAEILENEPEKFSPNVVLRPIYQEHILPNLSYSGGPAETIYWLQLKSAFEAASVPYPILLPRQFVMFLNENFSRKWFKAGLKEGDIFKTTEVLKKNFLANAEGQSLNFDDERKELTAFWEKIADKAETADRTLRDFVLAEGGKSLKSLENTERKIKKSLEIKHETAVKQIENLKDKIFPSGVPQERSDNFLTFYINRPDFLEEVFAHIKPFDLRFLTIWEQ